LNYIATAYSINQSLFVSGDETRIAKPISVKCKNTQTCSEVADFSQSSAVHLRIQLKELLKSVHVC